MRINVNQDDIDNGIRASCRYCPVAIALDRHNPNAYHRVYPDHIGGTAADTPLDKILNVLIDKYDCRQGMKPFDFEFVPGISATFIEYTDASNSIQTTESTKGIPQSTPF